MEVVQLKDGTSEIIGSHKDLVDIIRDKCGGEIATKVENLDPADWDNVYDAYEKMIDISDILDKDEVEENDIKSAKILIDNAIGLLCRVL